MRPWLESLFVSLLPFNSTDPFLSFTIDWFVCVIIIFALPPGDAYNFVINIVRFAFTYIPPAMITHPLLTGFLSPLRHQRRYFLWHHLPLSMALRRMAGGKRPRAVGSRLFRISKRLPLCRPFCASTRRSPAIYELTLLVACRSWMGHFWHRFFVLAGLGAFATPR
jgi:hypothetical protein